MGKWVQTKECADYFVDENGNVKSIKSGKEIILRPREKRGYYSVCMSINGKKKCAYIHRLVATAFLPNPYNKREVNHIDRNKHNNHVDNLEWVTPSENIVHGYLHGAYDELKTRPDVSNRNKQIFSKKIICEETGMLFQSLGSATSWLHQIGRDKAAKAGISYCLNGKKQSAYGFHWKFA